VPWSSSSSSPKNGSATTPASRPAWPTKPQAQGPSRRRRDPRPRPRGCRAGREAPCRRRPSTGGQRQLTAQRQANGRGRRPARTSTDRHVADRPDPPGRTTGPITARNAPDHPRHGRTGRRRLRGAVPTRPGGSLG
jgi:hypothetical protein